MQDAVAAGKPVDAYAAHRKLLEDDGVMDETAHVAMDSEIAGEIDDAVTFAQKSPFPARAELNRHIFA